MKQCVLALATMLLLQVADASAGLFDQGIGGAMYYGPYTGGHGYSYNTAYGYGFAFSAADTWRRDPLAYPAGIYPYRPYGWPITCRVFPTPETPYISVPGPDGLPILQPTVPPVSLMPGVPVLVAPGTTAVPQFTPAVRNTGTVKVHVPAGAEVWIDKEKTTQTGSDRVFQSPPLSADRTTVISIRAKWNEAGREFDQFRVVGLRPGETAKVTFSADRQ